MHMKIYYIPQKAGHACTMLWQPTQHRLSTAVYIAILCEQTHCMVLHSGQNIINLPKRICEQNHCMPWSVCMCLQHCNKMCSYFQTGNAMNVQLAHTSRQAYTTTAQDTFTCVGCAQPRIYTHY